MVNTPAGAEPISAITANAVAASRMNPSGMEPGSRRLFMESAAQYPNWDPGWRAASQGPSSASVGARHTGLLQGEGSRPR